MRLSLVVPATDGPHTLERCLAAARSAAEAPDEVVVVSAPRDSGPAAARNDGAARATGDLVAFVDADVLVHPDAFARIRRAFAADPGLVAVFGSYDDLVATEGVVAGFRNLLHHTVHQRSAGEAETFWAGLGAVRADALRAAGGFDADRYPRASIEDVELGGRLAGRGRIVLDPELRGTHLKEWSLASMVATDFARRGVPWVRLVLRRGEVPRTLNLGLRERTSVVAAIACAVGVAARRPGLVAAGVAAQVALNRDLYGILRRRLGGKGVAAGIGLHTLHQLTAAAAVPVGVAVALTPGSRGRR